MKINKRVLIATVLVFVITVVTAWICAPKVDRYEPYVVGYSDTLWSIAKEHNPDYTVVDDILYFMRRENGLKSSDIYPGDYILVPIMEVK